MQSEVGAPPVQGHLRVWWRHRGESFTDYHDLPIVNNEATAVVPAPGRLSYACVRMLGYWAESGSVREIAVDDAPLVVEIPVVPAGAIYGEVFEADGRPASGIMVSVIESKRSALKMRSSLGIDVKTSSAPDDSISRFSATPLPLHGEYVIIARRDSQYIASQPVELTPEEPVRELELRFTKGVIVSGQIVAPDGQPVRGCRYRLEWSSGYGHGFSGAELTSVADGRFRFEGVAPDVGGNYTLVVEKNPGWQRCVLPLRPDETPLTVQLVPGSMLRGVVIDDTTGQPVPEVEVYVIAADVTPGEASAYANADTKTDRQGRFIFTTLQPRRYVLHVRSRREINSVIATAGQDGTHEVRVR